MDGLAQFDAKELIQHRAIEPFDKVVDSGRLNLGAAMRDAVETRLEFVGMPFGAEEIAAMPDATGSYS